MHTKCCACIPARGEKRKKRSVLRAGQQTAAHPLQLYIFATSLFRILKIKANLAQCPRPTVIMMCRIFLRCINPPQTWGKERNFAQLI